MITKNDKQGNCIGRSGEWIYKKSAGSAKTLAEAIILQSMEDLWIEGEKSKCINFFTGEGFYVCAKMAGMEFNEQLKVLSMVKNIANKIRRAGFASRELTKTKGQFSEEVALM